MSKNIPFPTPEAVKAAIKNWDDGLIYNYLDDCLFAFFKQHRENKDFNVVKAKVTLVNMTYGTRLLSEEMKKVLPNHIVNLKIDESLNAGDLSIVNKIAKTENRNLYSFASKFCMFHNPEKFAVYDSNVDKALWYFYENDKDFRTAINFKRCELGNYERLMEILNAFRKHYGLEKFSYKELDHYLWEAGNGIN